MQGQIQNFPVGSPNFIPRVQACHFYQHLWTFAKFNKKISSYKILVLSTIYPAFWECQSVIAIEIRLLKRVVNNKCKSRKYISKFKMGVRTPRICIFDVSVSHLWTLMVCDVITCPRSAVDRSKHSHHFVANVSKQVNLYLLFTINVTKLV